MRWIATMAAALIAAAASVTPVAAQDTAEATAQAAARDCGPRLCYARNLEPFLAALDDARSNGRRPVHIMQVGDSHTAGDMISNGWRVPMQARFGFGGRGMLAPGRPYPGVITFGVTQTMSAGWTVNANFGKGWNSAGAPIGISGFSLTTVGGDERMGVSTDTPDQNFDRVTVCGVRRVGGGSAIIQLGAKTERLDLSGTQGGAACKTVDSDWRQSAAQLTTEGNGVVTITSFSTFVRKGGVVVSNLGVSGSQLTHLGREDDRVVADELAEYKPDLIVLAFGTNEGFSQALTPAVFEVDLRAQVRRLRRLAGRDVPILLIGAPDAGTSNVALARNYGSPVACPGDPGWYTPTLLSAIRERQRIVARDLKLGFWDWNAAMGGACAASIWRNADPPLVRGDHVHFTRAGGGRIGSMIFSDLDAAYARFAASRPR